MGQVPKILIIGSGRLATHLRRYFTLSEIPFSSWSRKENPAESLSQLAFDTELVLLAISDRAIETFVSENPFLRSKTLIHFSGSQTFPSILGFHPLMTFGPDPYELDRYRKIPFVGTRGSPTFSKIFPFLANPSFEIDAAEKPLYHALCVMGGNFTTLLWQNFISRMGEDFGILPETLFPYLEQTLLNFKSDPQTSLTGPFARKDLGTIRANLKALEGDSEEKLYRAFSQTYFPDFEGRIAREERS